MERAGLVGCGAIGLGLLRRLRLAGVGVTVYDIDKRARENAQQAGANVAGSPAEVARASTIVDVVVRTDTGAVRLYAGRRAHGWLRIHGKHVTVSVRGVRADGPCSYRRSFDPCVVARLSRAHPRSGRRARRSSH